jgi:hypothetical protein
MAVGSGSGSICDLPSFSALVVACSEEQVLK